MDRGFVRAVNDTLRAKYGRGPLSPRDVDQLPAYDRVFGDAVAADVEKVAEVAELVDGWRSTRTVNVEVAASGRLHARADALAEWARLFIESDMRVTSWRRRHIGGMVMSPVEATDWVHDRLVVERHGLSLAWAEYREEQWFTFTTPVAARTALGQLAVISAKLATGLRCIPASATVAVLTGERPAVQVLDATYQWQHRTHVEVGGADAFSTVKVTLDPAVPADALAEWWGKVQASLLPTTRRRYRLQSVRHARLAEFSATRGRLTTYAEDMVAWNKRFPEWRYSSVDTYRTDVNRAVTKLLECGWKPQSAR